MLFVQCLVLCILFTIAILPAQYNNPLCQLASYPTKIKKRVYELPQYKEYIASVEQKNWIRKFAGVFIIAILLAVVAYASGKRTFSTAFFHGFVLFQSVNLYDLIILDITVFCNSKKLMIPGTEDMKEEYKNPMHHIKGALIGVFIGTAVALVSALLIQVIVPFV